MKRYIFCVTFEWKKREGDMTPQTFLVEKPVSQSRIKIIASSNGWENMSGKDILENLMGILMPL